MSNQWEKRSDSRFSARNSVSQGTQYSRVPCSFWVQFSAWEQRKCSIRAAACSAWPSFSQSRRYCFFAFEKSQMWKQNVSFRLLCIPSFRLGWNVTFSCFTANKSKNSALCWPRSTKRIQTPPSQNVIAHSRERERLFFIVIALTLASVIPIFVYLWDGRLITVHAFVVGYLDAETLSGYIVTNWFHLTINVISVHFFIYCDTILATLIYNVSLFSGLIVHQMRNVSNLINHQKSENGELRLKVTLRNVIQMHLEMSE